MMMSVLGQARPGFSSKSKRNKKLPIKFNPRLALLPGVENYPKNLGFTNLQRLNLLLP